jgi:hypothetical protein
LDGDQARVRAGDPILSTDPRNSAPHVLGDQKVDDLVQRLMTANREVADRPGPITITLAHKSAPAVIEEVLIHAEARGIVSGIARLLVGSTLEASLGAQRCREIAAQHRWDNGHDDPSMLGDYRIENVAIEITMVEGPTESLLTKAKRITARGTDECWLIVRSDKIEAWQDYLGKSTSKHAARIGCFGISEFIGQSLMQTRWRSSFPIDPLRDVIAKLNQLVERLGPPHLLAARVELVG